MTENRIQFQYFKLHNCVQNVSKDLQLIKLKSKGEKREKGKTCMTRTPEQHTKQIAAKKLKKAEKVLA